MDGTPFFLMGLIVGAALTLGIQWFANRRVRKALDQLARAPQRDDDALLQRRETGDIKQRLAVLEQIITDQPHQLAGEIERLR
jgi:HAMP domain-containing protein